MEQRAARGFQAVFGQAPRFTARAPGRVNLIGEHTDYNGGFVLPTAIPQETRVELSPRSDRTVRAFSADVGTEGELKEFQLGEEALGHTWLDYVQGVTRTLQREGYRISGFEVRISSEVPLGSGLSSSAALDVSLMRGLRQAFSLTLDDVKLAQLGQKVETDFVGAPVGVMDPMACSLSGHDTALFVDTRSLAFERVPIPKSVELVVINSGVAHQHSNGDYRVRRAECERAAGLLGVAQLRDLTEVDLPRAMALPEPLGRRVRHVVTEDARVLATVEALRKGDLSRLGKLLNDSHDSQRDDYAVSIPEIDLLVNIGREEPDILGARLTGGGFGGSVLMMAKAGTGAAAAARIAQRYAERSGQKPTVLVPQGGKA